LLALYWLYRYPVYDLLADEFGISEQTAILRILDDRLGYLLEYESLRRRRIKEGPFADSVGAVDTFPLSIPEPPRNERKLFYVYGKRHRSRYAWKIQVFSDFDGRIRSVSDAHPFGSISDIRLLRESEVEPELGPKRRAAHIAENLYSKVERRYPADTEDEDEGLESRIMALGDKAYQGHDYVFVPYKRNKSRTSPQEEKEWNKELSSRRVIVENVNKRLEDFKAIGTIYRGARDKKFVSLVVRVAASLYNLKREQQPQRRFRKH
jgi:hypothetical protein